VKALTAGSFTLLAASLLMLVGCSEKKAKSTSEPSKAREATAVSRDSQDGDEPSRQPDQEAPPRQGEDGVGQKRANYRSKQLAAYDKDGDGVFSPEERQAMVEERVVRTFDELDSNGDNRLGKHEVAASSARMARRLERRFEQLDANGDGVLTRDETKKLMTGRRRGPGSKRPAPGGSAPSPGQ
jgi:hypothetical protein